MMGRLVSRAVGMTLVAALGVAPNASAQDIGIPVGTRAPGATLETLDGGPVELSRYLDGRPALIEFWAAWCENCKALEPQLHALHRRYGERLRMIAVAVSVNQSPERARRYAERQKLPMTMLYDRKGDATVAYDVPATSYVVVVDASGSIVYTGLGGDQQLDEAVKKALQ